MLKENLPVPESHSNRVYQGTEQQSSTYRALANGPAKAKAKPSLPHRVSLLAQHRHTE